MRRIQGPVVLEYLRTSLWPVPAAAIVLAFVLAAGLAQVDPLIDQRADYFYLFGGEAETARSILSTIATSLLTLTGVVFSITVLVLQLASTQFSSRVMRTFLEDGFTQFTMGVFAGGFIFCMLVLPQVRAVTSEQGGYIPRASISAAVCIVIMGVFVLVRYIHHMAQSIRAVHILTRVAAETRHALERMFPHPCGAYSESFAAPEAPPEHVVEHDRPAGVVLSVDELQLRQLACKFEVVIGIVRQVGDFVPRGAPLFELWGRTVPRELLRKCVAVGPERTPVQDPAFGLRQLVDVAERALSPGINDPTTAVQALDQLHDLLRSLVAREIPGPARFDEQGRLRLILPRPNWDAYVRLSLEEIRHYGSRSVQVTRRMRGLLDDLLTVAPPERRPVLHEQRTLLDAAVDREFAMPQERAHAKHPSHKGEG